VLASWWRGAVVTVIARRILLVAVSLLATRLVAQVRPARNELTTAGIAQRAIPATVTIVTLGDLGDTLGLGSGFLVRSDGVVITNWHVVQGAYRAIIILSNGNRVQDVKYLASNRTADLVLLKIPVTNLPILPLDDSVPLIGSRVVVVGSPLGLSQTVSEGIVSASRVVGGLQYVQLTAAISPGSSGGPILDASGHVFAVATATITSGQALNFGVPVRYARSLLRGTPQPRPLAATTARSSPQPRLNADDNDATSPFISIYEGTVTNDGFPDWPATLHIGFEGWTPSPHGYLLIGSPLGGSGPVTLGWIQDQLGLLTHGENGDTIFWIGRLVGDDMTGTYRVIGGKWTGQTGRWAVHRRSGVGLPKRPR
jgi:S1-C subfamily serine protease